MERPRHGLELLRLIQNAVALQEPEHRDDFVLNDSQLVLHLGICNVLRIMLVDPLVLRLGEVIGIGDNNHAVEKLFVGICLLSLEQQKVSIVRFAVDRIVNKIDEPTEFGLLKNDLCKSRERER
jgi:hypothetical protein